MEPEDNNIIVVEKASQQLFLYKYDGAYQKVFSMKCSTGKVPGNKLESGDKKTPEGVYFCTKEFKKRDLSPIYGTRAFPIDYPNWMDRSAGKNGNAIWIHGTNKKLKVRDSNGCIALNNSDINQLSSYIALNRTPVILVDKLTYVAEDAVVDTKAAVAGFLEKWARSFDEEDMHAYLSCYDSEYRPDPSWWEEWKDVKNSMAGFGESFSVAFENVSGHRHNGTIVLLFDQVLQSEKRAIYIGTRKLFLSGNDSEFRIIGDEYQVLDNRNRSIYAYHRQPMLSAMLYWEKELMGEQEIIAMIEDWRKAWTSKNFVAYGNHYAENFKSNGMNRSAWLRHKRSLNKKYDFIQVEIDDLVISKEKNRSTVTFIQKYKSNMLSDIGSKKLVLKLEGGKWKIMREIWKKG